MGLSLTILTILTGVVQAQTNRFNDHRLDLNLVHLGLLLVFIRQGEGVCLCLGISLAQSFLIEHLPGRCSRSDPIRYLCGTCIDS